MSSRFSFRLPLFWKFTIAIIIIVALFGSINTALIWRFVYEPLDEQLENRGLFIARNLAHEVLSPILYDDMVVLQKKVDQVKEMDTTVEYVFIVKENRPLVHTFDIAVPSELIAANRLSLEDSLSIKRIVPKHEPEATIKDIAVPVYNSQIGMVRLGIREKEIRDDLNNTYMTFAFMISLFLLLGIFGAFAFSYYLTGPIKQIAKVTSQIDFNSLSLNHANPIKLRQKFLNRFKVLWRAEDELDVLNEKFNEMISRLGRAYSDLKSTQLNLLQSEKLASVGILAAGIAHEINNPIAGLQNCIRRLMKNPDHLEQNKKYLAMMEDAASRIETIVQGLLNFSRKHDQHFENISLAGLIENALMLTGYRLEQHRIGFEKIYPPDIPDIRGNANQLVQVFVNLIMNSVDAMVQKAAQESHYHPKIIFRILLQPESVRLEIEDNGTGMPEENIHKIFDPFFTTKKPGEGTGLGLAVSYNIIREHHGTITVQSEPGKSTVVKIVLPTAPLELINIMNESR